MGRRQGTPRIRGGGVLARVGRLVTLAPGATAPAASQGLQREKRAPSSGPQVELAESAVVLRRGAASHSVGVKNGLESREEGASAIALSV